MGKTSKPEIRANYDFSRGVRGNHRHFAGQKSTVRITHPDGSVSIEETEPPKEAIFLEPDLR